MRDPKHEDCFREENCGATDCPGFQAAERRRKRDVEAQRGAWSALVVRSEGLSGHRHYLDGKPIHCGSTLELQAVEDRIDEDGNEYSVFVQRGHCVRYEATFNGAEIDATLYAGIGGYTFVASATTWMRFRWPVRS